MKWVRENWFLLALIAFFMSGNAFQLINPKIEIQKVETIIKDTSAVLELRMVEAELAYLKVNPIVKYKTRYLDVPKKDTIYIRGEQFTVPHYTASIDTVINKDIVKVKYEYPLNQFDIYIKKHFEKTTVKTTIIKKPLIDFSHGIIAGAFVVPDGKVLIGIGYGFKLGLNF